MIGTPQMPPYYALGFIQGSQLDLAKISDLIKNSSDFAIEGFHLDSYYKSGDLFNPANPTDLEKIIN